MLKRFAPTLQRLPEGSRFVAAIALYGLTASLAAVAFQVAINWIFWASFVYPSQVSPHWFPWISCAIDGVLMCAEFTQARAEKRPVRLLAVVTARPSQTIRECQALLIESSCGMIVITDKPQGSPLAVLTLHDLLRAQSAVSDRES